ncbi:MAG: sensor histidine kinase [Ilumatobacteraceae bacterium]|nr:sensor histidine kinase [Ilumatobacteraceae bacterium]
MSVRLKLTLSYTGFLVLAGAVLLAAVWLYLLRYVPDRAMLSTDDPDLGTGVFPIRSTLLRVFAPRAAVAMGVLLVIGLVGGWLLAGRMLRPLERITAATRLAGTGSLAHRIEMEGRQDEFRELADAFDTMLARLEAHVDQQRRFSANASHELRTPLAITKTLLEVASRQDDPDVDALIDRLQTVNDRAIGLTQALLVLSQADQRSFAHEAVDLSLIVEEALEALLPVGDQHGVEIEIDGGPAPTTGSHALLLQLTTNLAHNAIVHNQPEHGTVWITTGADETAVLLEVANTGAVVSSEVATTLTEPFQRGAERIRTEHEGVGLGLAIARSIATAHDGTLSVAPRPGGGLTVSVRLPA